MKITFAGRTVAVAQDSLAASPGLQPPPLAPSAARRRVTFAEEPQVFLIPALRQLWLVARKCDLWHGHAEEEESAAEECADKWSARAWSALENDAEDADGRNPLEESSSEDESASEGPSTPPRVGADYQAAMPDGPDIHDRAEPERVEHPLVDISTQARLAMARRERVQQAEDEGAADGGAAAASFAESSSVALGHEEWPELDLEELFGSTGVLPGWLDALDSLSAPEAAVGGKRRRADEEPLDELGALGLPPLRSLRTGC